VRVRMCGCGCMCALTGEEKRLHCKSNIRDNESEFDLLSEVIDKTEH
jgi:hypothetical protein